ncbi:MAG: chromosome segregation protein SMC [Oscillospiraceae bacterium]
MHLKYLEIQGFKSFPDKTKIMFEKGYTGIVGPNGSGKSNISDAIKWVLGEQSSKSLRGGKMEDVIFGGTQLRKPMGFAQVSLCLDNTDVRISDVGDEIAITRRYYRSGDSEYLINGSPVRLRDVREMFMDTGLGRDGYSIISQGKISEIVSAKSNERRELFEEASGIAKYRFRKNEATRKLDAAEDNISRLRDIIDVLEERIEPLRQQSEKAEKFIALSNEKKSLEITLYCDTIDRSRDNLRKQDDKISIAKQDYDSAEKSLEEMTERTEQLGDDNRRRNVEIEQFNAGIFETNGQISKLESEIAVEKNDMQHTAEQIDELASRIENMSDSKSAVSVKIDEKKLLINSKKEELDELDALIELTRQELDELIENNEISDRNRVETAKRLTLLQAEITDLRVATVGAQSTNETLESRAEVLKEQLPQIEQRHADSEKELRESGEYFESIKSDISECENRINGYTLKLSSRKERLGALNSELEKKNGEISEAAHRAAVLKDMEKNMDGFQPSVRRVVEASGAHQLRGIVGTVASLITIRRGCELAIETALGAAAQNLVVEDERAAKDAIAYLKDAKAGRATFLPLDTVKPGYFDGGANLSDSGIVGLASDLVKIDGRYDKIISSLLGRIVVAEEINSASVLAKKLNYRYRIVTMDGQVINAGGSYTGGSSSRQASLFGRKSEIEALEAKIEQIKASTISTRGECEKLNSDIAELEAEITAIGSDLVTHNEDRIRVESQIMRCSQDAKTLGSALDDIKRELAAIDESKNEKQELIANNDSEIKTLAEEIERLNIADDGENQNNDGFMRRRSELSERVSQQKIARVELQKDIESLESEVSSLSALQNESAEAASSIENSIAKLRATLEELKAAAEAKAFEAAGLREQIIERRQDIENAVCQRNETEREITELRGKYSVQTKQREDIGRELTRLEERKNSLSTEFDSTVAKLWEEYELTQKEAQSLCVAFESITELRSQVGTLRAKIRALGSVNVAAIEEYKEVTDQYTHLSEQVSDIEKSKAELLKLIASLETEMKIIFTKSFNEINNHFRRVFVELFGGGSANLSLTDENDVLESGIEIDVQPPGKLIKNLSSLSGGEQALVAIAIYFSILAVNPSPFCILDEIDSALDEANVNRFAGYLNRVTDSTQIITITHRRGTMEGADTLYGITMQEEGVSKVLKLGIDEAQLVISK